MERTRILLKARPTVGQLRDRLAEPVPEGLELYLDQSDLAGDDYVARTRETVAAVGVPAGFTWIVEAPIRTLAGAFFALTADTADARATIDRVVAVGTALGAVAANVHVVAPTRATEDLDLARRDQKLAACRPLLRYYVDRCEAAGLVPQVENIPPVGRMREGAFVFSPIGAAADDLIALGATFPTLRFTVDVSHAALALNWRRAEPVALDPGLGAVAAFTGRVETSGNLASFVARLADRTTTVHVSNATGLLGEGLRYADGDEDLDRALAPLVGLVPYFVTETLESDDERATGMRDAQLRLVRLRETTMPLAIGGD
jgi:hypothetical protein